MDYLHDIKRILDKTHLNGKKEGFAIALQYLQQVSNNKIKLEYAIAVIQALIENS